jgi:predicted  nucleic acid-binding Zn-ribbon protein
LEEEITAALREKEEVISINEALNSELEDLTEKLSTSTSEIYDLKEEISALVSCSVQFFLGFSF